MRFALAGTIELNTFVLLCPQGYKSPVRDCDLVRPAQSRELDKGIVSTIFLLLRPCEKCQWRNNEPEIMFRVTVQYICCLLLPSLVATFPHGLYPRTGSTREVAFATTHRRDPTNSTQTQLHHSQHDFFYLRRLHGRDQDHIEDKIVQDR